MGHEFSAEVVAVGPEVTGWSPGMRVTVNPNGNICGACPQCRTGRYNLCPVATQVMSLGVCRDGGMAEYAAVPAVHLHALPDTVDGLRGAWTEPLAVAVRSVASSGIRLGDDVTVIGGGPIGLLVVQLARRAGARRVTLIEPSAVRRSRVPSSAPTTPGRRPSMRQPSRRASFRRPTACSNVQDTPAPCNPPSTRSPRVAPSNWSPSRHGRSSSTRCPPSRRRSSSTPGSSTSTSSPTPSTSWRVTRSTCSR